MLKFDVEDFIVDEEATVILVVRRLAERVQRGEGSVGHLVAREGDAILAVVRAGTKEPWAIFSSFGKRLRHAGARRAPRPTASRAEAVNSQGRREGRRAAVCDKAVLTPGLGGQRRRLRRRFNLDPTATKTRSGRRFAKVGDAEDRRRQVVAAKRALLSVVTVGLVGRCW